MKILSFSSGKVFHRCKPFLLSHLRCTRTIDRDIDESSTQGLVHQLRVGLHILFDISSIYQLEWLLITRRCFRVPASNHENRTTGAPVLIAKTAKAGVEGASFRRNHPNPLASFALWSIKIPTIRFWDNTRITFRLAFSVEITSSPSRFLFPSLSDPPTYFS